MKIPDFLLQIVVVFVAFSILPEADFVRGSHPSTTHLIPLTRWTESALAQQPANFPRNSKSTVTLYEVAGTVYVAGTSRHEQPLTLEDRKRNISDLNSIMESFTSGHRIYDKLYKFAFFRQVPERDIPDILQETWMKAFRTHSLFLGGSKPYSYLLRILKRTILNYFRSQDRHPGDINSIDDLVETDRFLSSDISIDSTLDFNRLLQSLRQEIARLKPGFAAVLRLWLSDFEYLEIADILQIPVDTVKSRIFRAKADLREAMLKPLTRTA